MQTRAAIATAHTLAEKIGWGYLVITTGGLAGYAPVAPGTMGTVVAVPVYWLLMKLGWAPYLIVSLTLFWLGIQGADRIELATAQKDSGIIVIDEIVGYLITMLFLPERGVLVVVGFFVFRLLDILKPYPIRRLDRAPNLKGFGVMMDDVLAGVYGNIILQLVVLYLRQ
ncbi:phosphatidylglycerophosphatase A [candidate division KSB3 bacterium]|uniref:Phosphatidylglycerophosphatase A n=1 Tax=candidate division KSB3 bacterium TaxID=2044937 RepID=A0A9D5JTN7_9BACT|nr:phosphatidylglycerophosphatase A [candidate division KSB3 bacterium]MBD3324048.1 phosphatidylglycerophosphatase A [candidate division KSB3 bacterium]